MRDVLFYPDPINEKAARLVATGVFSLGLLTLLTGWHWLLVPLAYGFVARVLTGPYYSPLARLAAGLAPRFGPPQPVPGPPKRFAQGMGAAMTVTAAVASLAFGAQGVAEVLLVLLLVASGLEAFLAFCLGCTIFAGLIRLGVIPDEICERCADLSLRRA